MKTEAKHWMDLAESDYDASLYLFRGARYPHAVYFLCQSIEKLLKSVQVELTNTAPKKIHRLENLANQTPLKFSGEHLNTLTDLSKHYSRVRYPDISQTHYNTREKTTPIMRQGKEMYQWIKQKFVNH